jgi:hypothetical protein
MEQQYAAVVVVVRTDASYYCRHCNCESDPPSPWARCAEITWRSFGPVRLGGGELSSRLHVNVEAYSVTVQAYSLCTLDNHSAKHHNGLRYRRDTY